MAKFAVILLGSRKPLLNQLYSFQQNIWFFFRALLRYPRYNERSRRFIRWMIMNGWREVPAAPRRTPHFHINLLPEARKISTTRALMSAYLSYLYRCGEKRVYGQIVTFESRRGEKMFERYGFRVMNRAEITKYQGFLSGIGLSQHRDQESGDGRAALRLRRIPLLTSADLSQAAACANVAPHFCRHSSVGRAADL